MILKGYACQLRIAQSQFTIVYPGVIINSPNFTLKDISRKMKEIYSRYKNIEVIDCYDFVPTKEEYFSNKELMLHPSSLGHDVYGKMLINALIPIFGDIDKTNDESMAELIINLAK